MEYSQYAQLGLYKRASGLSPDLEFLLWNKVATMGKDVVEVIGAIGAQFGGSLEGLRDSVTPVGVH
jgi:hypothetical protein